jgi:multicomponent Na+:H+ antiporter subunit E
VAYFLGLVAALVAFWVGNSGHYTPLMLGFAAVSIVLTIVLAFRLDIVDREGSPYARLPQLLKYYPWLAVEVVKANWVVIKACLRADLDITPTLTKIKTVCKTDLAKVTFANSITMTPGTVTVEIDGDKLLIHGLYESGTQPEAFIEMDQRCALACDPKEVRA